ncbi:MAG: serine hydrolase domain-containing protein [Parvularculaceae bacterium]
MLAKLAVAVIAALVAAAAGAGLIFAAALEGWGRPAAAERADVAAFLAAMNQRLDAHKTGNAAFLLIEAGEPVGEHFVSKGAPVDRDTLFQVASLSKWATAWGVMTLVERGAIDLDAPVSKYLTRWSLPPSEFDNDKVTVRRLLSHLAGLSDGLGYAGFEQGAPMPTLEESLTRASDASPGADGRVRVGEEPGSKFEYSGGGYTLLQLLIEETSGQSFNDYMEGAVFGPLGMSSSTFVPDAGAEARIAEIYGADGALAARRNFVSLAATSLYTSSADMARFVAAHRPGAAGEPAGRGVLKPGTLKAMRAPEASVFGAAIWGLGVILYADNNRGDYIIGHDGSNEPAINTSVRLDPDTGDGVVVLETGDKLLASRLAGDWVFWKTGHVDTLTVIAEFRGTMRKAAIAGAAGFLLAFASVFLVTRRRA